jgi:hypothetical protein
MTVGGRSRFRLGARQAIFLVSSVLVLLLGAFMLAAITIYNNSFMRLEMGRHSIGFNPLHAITPTSVLGLIGLAALVGLAAAYVLA